MLQMYYKVYHDTGAMSREYTCERIEYKGTYVLLHNVCGSTIARQLCLSPARGDIRVEEMARKLQAVA